MSSEATLTLLLTADLEVESVADGVFRDEDPALAMISSALEGEFWGVIFLNGLRTEKKPPSKSRSESLVVARREGEGVAAPLRGAA